jgi:hypothetical protein
VAAKKAPSARKTAATKTDGAAQPATDGLRGDSRADALAEHRRYLANAIEIAKPRELPQLVREHRAVMAELESLRPRAASRVDEIRNASQRRKARTENRRSQPRRRTGTQRSG